MESNGLPEAPRQQQLIVTIFGVFCRDPECGIAVADLISLLSNCGVESSAVRSSVSRLKKRALLVNRRQGRATVYAPSQELFEVFTEGDEHIFSPRRAAVDDPWLLAAFTVPEAKRHLRHRIRSTFTKWGAGVVTPGVWIVPELNFSKIRSELRREKLTQFVEFFSATYLNPDELASKVSQWWDLPALAGLYEQFVSQWQGLADETANGVELSDADAFCKFVHLLTQWRRLPYLDPGLPLECLPDPWPAQDATELMQTLHSRLEVAATRYYDNTVKGLLVGS